MAEFDRETVGARGGGFGLDAELARQREAKYDHGAEDEARVRVYEKRSQTWRSSSYGCPRMRSLLTLIVPRTFPGRLFLLVVS